MAISSRGMRSGAARELKALEHLRQRRGAEAASAKLALMRRLREEPLAAAQQVLRLHEVLCFLRAYPDNRAVRSLATRMLMEFSDRDDLRKHADALTDSGIAGTSIHYPFYFPTAMWLARRWPEHLHIDWSHYDDTASLEQLLPVLLPSHESMAVDDTLLSARELIEHLKGHDETDAQFVLRRFQALTASAPLRQKIYEDLDIPLVLTPGRDTPSRTRSSMSGAPSFFVGSTPPKDRDWRRMKPRRVEAVSPRRGQRLLELARTQMITRSRDLYAFMHGDSRSIRVFHMDDALQFACIGLEVPHRFTLETLYVYVALQSGIPVGYVQATALLGSAEINFNIFDSFRGAQARHVFRAVLAMVRADIGCDTFIMNTQQLGEDNDEALKTGAWWFYYKHGFRPRDPQVIQTMQAEVTRKTRDPSYRTDRATLKKLASAPLFLSRGPVRKHTVNNFASDHIGLAMSSCLSDRGGADREAALESCARDAVEALGLEREPATSANERLAWRRWAPLILVLPGLAGWSSGDKRALARIAIAKGGPSESAYLSLFDAHPRLRRALIRLADDAEAA